MRFIDSVIFETLWIKREMKQIQLKNLQHRH